MSQRLIHKVELLAGVVMVIPGAVKLLHADVQRDRPVLWYEYDADASHKTSTVYVAMTGDSVPTGLEYVGTFQIGGGAFVGHVYGAPCA